MKKMSCLFAAVLFLSLFSPVNLSAAEKLDPMVIEEGGTGPYKAVLG